MPASAPGPLILVGGAEFMPGNEPHDRIFAAAAGRGPAYVLATAAVRQDPDRAVVTARAWFGGLGLDVEELVIRGRRDAGRPDVVAAAGEGRGFYLCGGDPGLVVQLLAGTPAWGAIVKAWRRGAALAGSSAGAMAFGEWSLIRSGTSHARRRFAPALGILPNVAVVPHFDEFGEGWLRSLRRPRRDVVLLGLDTRSAAVWRPRLGWRSMGAGRTIVLTSAGRLVRVEGGRPTGIGRPAAQRRA